MDETLRQTILALLAEHRVMTVATLRPDGWPQATTVGYASEGLTLYFLCAPDSQKAANLAEDDRVSLTIDGDTPDILTIRGLSMAAHATPVTDPVEVGRILSLIVSRYPAQPDFPLPMPGLDQIRIFKVTPVLISVLDYSKGFAHTDLVVC